MPVQHSVLNVRGESVVGAFNQKKALLLDCKALLDIGSNNCSSVTIRNVYIMGTLLEIYLLDIRFMNISNMFQQNIRS